MTLEIEEKESLLEALQKAILDQEEGVAHHLLEKISCEETRRLVSRLSLGEREQLCELLPAIDVAHLFENLVYEQAVEILEELPSNIAAEVVTEMKNNEASDLLRELDKKDSSAILDQLASASESDDLRERITYAENTAGALMGGNVVSFLSNVTAAEVKEVLAEGSEGFSDSDIRYLYITDDQKRLVGVLGLRDLVFAKRAKLVSSFMKPDPLFVKTSTPLKELEEIFDEKAYLGIPVVDSEGRLKGIVTREEVEEALGDNQTDDYLKSAGIIGGEELRSMPLPHRCVKRLTWLAPNIILNLLAASVIATYEETLQAVIALAIFLPMVSDMSGCSGNQAVAVSIRELTLGILKPKDFVRVMFKEGLLGMINGLILGCVLGTIATLWKGSIVLGCVVGGALALNTILSVLIGGLIPLLLKRFKADPALASGPILTTCTDMCGFFLILNFANLTLSQLLS